MFALDSILVTGHLLSLSLTVLSSSLASFLALPLDRKSVQYLLPCTHHNNETLVNAFSTNCTTCSCHIFGKKLNQSTNVTFQKEVKCGKANVFKAGKGRSTEQAHWPEIGNFLRSIVEKFLMVLWSRHYTEIVHLPG